jgi:hypothetical protein
MKEHPLDRDAFMAAFRKAPEIKEDYYTILSEKDAWDRFTAFLESDELLGDMIR